MVRGNFNNSTLCRVFSIGFKFEFSTSGFTTSSQVVSECLKPAYRLEQRKNLFASSQSKDMENNWLWYIAGAFDSVGTLSAKIQEDDRRSVGHQFQPKLTLSRPKSREVVFGMLDEYATESGAKYHIEEMENSLRLVINDAQSIERFLTPITPGIVQQEREVEIMLEEIIPALKEDKHTTKEGFVEIMESVDELRESVQTKGSPKYTSTHFKKKWAGEI